MKKMHFRSDFSHRALPALIAAAFLIALSACAGHNIHKDLTADPQVLVRRWTLQTHGPFEAGDKGYEYSNPVVTENTVIFGNQSTGLISLYPGMLQTRWVLPIKGGVISELAQEKTEVYFGGGDGFLYSVSVETGRVNWRYDLKNPLISKPTVSGGRVFITTSDDTVYAFDAATGKWLWHYRRRTSPTATILGASSPLVDGAEVITGMTDGFLVSLSVNDGQLKWERKIHQGTKFTDVDAHPVLDNSILYIPSYDGALYALKRANGEVIWRYDVGGSKQVVADETRLFVPSSNGTIYSLQKNNSKVLWQFEMDHGVPTQLVVTDRYVMVGSSSQYLYVLDKETGKGLYRFNVGEGSGFSGSPAFDSVHQRLYMLSSAGNLYSFQLSSPPKKIRPHGVTSPYAATSGF
ncbi:MAG: PQQ-binding-like beta-propeller repeat protein [Methylotenera sp.]|nr:PQQ-binding-like beta-propeller repeat protein [Oligoflexia bacterium]